MAVPIGDFSEFSFEPSLFEARGAKGSMSPFLRLTLAAAGALTTLSGAAGAGNPPKPTDKPADGPKATAERRLPGTTPLFKRTTVGTPPDANLEKERDAGAVKWLEELYAAVI